jgi:hypothetical protein
MTETKTMYKYKIIEYDGNEKLEASFGLVRPAGQATGCSLFFSLQARQL